MPYQIKKSHHVTYQKFLQYKEPENYLFSNSKYTSPFTLNAAYLIDHIKIKGKLGNYDPLKRSFLFLPNENPKRPIIVPQEYLILNDDSLLQEDMPKGISDPLPPIQPFASQPLGDCEKSFYYAIAKKGYSNNELLFIVSHLISMLTKGNMKEHTRTNQEPSKRPTNDIPKPESFPPTEEIQKYQQLMAILIPYLNPKNYIIITITDVVNTLEQARDLLQNMTFDTTKLANQLRMYEHPWMKSITYVTTVYRSNFTITRSGFIFDRC